MSDQRTKQTGLTVTLLAQYFHFLLCGDDVTHLVQQAQSMEQQNINFNILVDEKWLLASLPESLHSFVIMVPSLETYFSDSPQPNTIVCLSFKNDQDSNSLLESLKEKHIFCINLSSETLQGNASLPAIFSLHDGLEISVHSNGRLDRKARTMVDYLMRQTQNIADITLLVIGTDHQLLNLEEREPYHLQSSLYDMIAEQLSLIAGIQEFFILNTCNRIEVYAIVGKQQATIQVLTRLLNFDHLREDQYYIKYDTNAFTHMCLVLCGLLSQVPGETHVVQQMKKSVESAKANKWAGGLLQQVFNNALFVSKNTRQKTSPHLHQLEIEDLSTRYAQEAAHHLTGKTIMILGAGVVGQGLVDRILVHSPREIILVYRSRIPDISRYSGEKITLLQTDHLAEMLPRVDTIFSAVSTNRFILHVGHKQFFKKQTPVLIIDICVPRSVDHNLNKDNPNISIIDIESIKKWYLNIAKDLEAVKTIGLNEIINRTGRYEKILDKEWLQEQ